MKNIPEKYIHLIKEIKKSMADVLKKKKFQLNEKIVARIEKVSKKIAKDLYKNELKNINSPVVSEAKVRKVAPRKPRVKETTPASRRRTSTRNLPSSSKEVLVKSSRKRPATVKSKTPVKKATTSRTTQKVVRKKSAPKVAK